MNRLVNFKNTIFSLPAYMVCLCLISPLLFFCFRLESLAFPQIDSFFYVLLMTVVQAGGASLISLLLAILASRGMLALANKKYYFLIEGLILLPCLIPPLLLVLSLVQLVESFISFPFGLPALIVTQTLTYTGLCTVAFTRTLLKEVSPLSEWAYLQNSSSWLFLKKLLKSLLLKDIKILFVLVFASSFTSLSLPLLTAGSSSFSLEFFIYEHLKDPELWSQALSLILFQSFFIFLICLWAFSKKAPSDFHIKYKKIYLLPNVFFAFIPFFAVFLSLAGLFYISDLGVFSKLWALRDFIFSSSLNSLIVGLGTGFLTLFFLILMSLSFQNLRARKFVASFMPPGASFIGFVFLIIPFYGQGFILMKWILGLALLFFPWIYRFRGERALDQLSSQVETARFMGAGCWFIFRKILLPQTRSVFFLCAGISSFWACGDFSYSLIVSSGQWNLSLLLYDFFSSYRLDEAVLLSWLLLFLSFFVLMFWLGVRFVFDKKFIL